MAEGTDGARAWGLPAPGRKMNRRQSVVTGCSMSLGWAEADLVPELLPISGSRDLGERLPGQSQFEKVRVSLLWWHILCLFVFGLGDRVCLCDGPGCPEVA